MIEAGSRVGIYGGAFDPPHASHVMVAAYALSCLGLDHLLILPCADHPFGKQMAGFDLRMEMARMAFSFLGDRVHVLNLEAKMPQPSYTINTVEALMATYPDVDFTLLIGSDNMLDKWHRGDELAKMVHVHVVKRGGDGVLAFPPVSSSLIRSLVAAGKDIDGLVPDAVGRFIKDKGLYRSAS